MTGWTDNCLAWVQSATPGQINAVIAAVAANSHLDETGGDRLERAETLTWLATRGQAGCEWGHAAEPAREVGGYVDRKPARALFHLALCADPGMTQALTHDAVTAAEAETVGRILDVIDNLTDPATAEKIAEGLAAHLVKAHAEAKHLVAMLKRTHSAGGWLADPVRTPAEQIRDSWHDPANYTGFHTRLAGAHTLLLPFTGKSVDRGFAGPKECHTTRGGIRVHVKPWCRCKR